MGLVLVEFAWYRPNPCPGCQSVPTLRFLADFAIGCLFSLDLVLADQTPMQVETAVATFSAERFPLIAGWCRKPHAANAGTSSAYFGFL